MNSTPASATNVPMPPITSDATQASGTPPGNPARHRLADGQQQHTDRHSSGGDRVNINTREAADSQRDEGQQRQHEAGGTDTERPVTPR